MSKLVKEPSSNLVSIVRLESYEPKAVEIALEKILEPLGTIERFITPDEPVVIKPNFLAPRTVEKAVCTHPEIIRGVAKLVRDKGTKDVIVTDSSGVGSATLCAKRLGIDKDPLFDIENTGEAIEGIAPEASFHKLKFSKRIKEARTLINLPKAKTHAKTGITAAVKNCFGAVAGMEKVQWHFRIGKDPRPFAELMVQIHEMVRPTLNILDAVVGMEGNGPGSGDPRPLGFIMASTDAHAMDAVLCRILGVGPKEVLTLAVAEDQGLLGPIDNIEIVGEDIESLRPSPPWRMARPSPINRFVEFEWATNLLDRFFSLRPMVDQKKCTGCGSCAQICQANAITIDKEAKKKAIIDHDPCISCFCCQEICPEGAIEAKAGIISRLLKLGTVR